MDQNNNYPQPNNPTPEWLTQSQAPIQNPISPQKPKRPRLIIPGIILGAIIICAGIVAFILLSNHKTTCLDNEDYAALTGNNLSDATSTVENFYSDYLLFKADSLNYDDTSDDSAHGAKLIQHIADFYKSHQAKPIIITVSATYLTPEAQTLAAQRITAAKSSLVAAGIPSDNIHTAGVSYIEPEEEPASSTDNGETTIAITSSPTCK